ncbi:MAG: hypothetical protein U1F09_13145 [Steroidobacteraceae bacterium]
MLILTGTTDKLQVITSAALSLHCHASYSDLNGNTVTPGRTNTPITTATTTDVVGAPGAGVQRTVHTFTARNRDATTANDVTIVLTDGTNAMELIEVTLPAGFTLHYHKNAGFWVTDTRGAAVTVNNLNGTPAATNSLNLVVLSADVTNNNATANTMADVTGLSFSVTAGETYAFSFIIPYTAAATTTGSRWSINGPASPTLLNYTSRYTLTATTVTYNYATAYDTPSGANATSLTAGNVAMIDGIIKPSANGTVIARFASEISSSAIVAKAGALLKWYRVL